MNIIFNDVLWGRICNLAEDAHMSPEAFIEMCVDSFIADQRPHSGMPME
jgi:hypothetical protein